MHFSLPFEADLMTRHIAGIWYYWCVFSFKGVITVVVALIFMFVGNYLAEWWKNIVSMFTTVYVLLVMKLSSASTCVSSLLLIETDRKLGMPGSRIWNMLMNLYNNNLSSHIQWKENEKFCKGFCLIVTLNQDKTEIILSQGNVCLLWEIAFIRG